ncbi:hypothetical protein H5410_054659 [Solanum commersonii]|uniref:Exostosin GT47 domain-containing protein n=1 Tax=Solanum commersonii TaxID=4109 RepID=A0A9J5WGE6_SOLCO|nr:hypothetical protein H5410_054659 [Solanum commersonii]
MWSTKLSQPPASSYCSLQSSLLSLAILTLLSFTYLSLKSFHSPNSPSSETPSLIVQSSQVVRAEQEVLSDVYNSPEVFRLNYEEMERKFKVFIYKDGDPKTFYQTPRKLTGKYSSEGYFFQNIRESKFVTEDPNEAHLFFIPISCHKMRGKGTSYENMTIIVQNYVDSLIAKYPYWNRTMGADHFFVTCHDVGVRATEGYPFLVKNAIRVVCSPSYDVGYIPHKDVALPQVLQPFALPAGGNDIENRSLRLYKSVDLPTKDRCFVCTHFPCNTVDPSKDRCQSNRLTTLGFWAGHRNSKIRVILARQWENDTELDISNNRINRATGPLVYQKRFYRTKFCICPGGSQVNSARITDSIHYGCVPVILSDYYDLPFNDIIDWCKFAVVLREKDVYDLKQILKNITQEEFATLHNNLVKVQKHFQWNSPPIRHDAFHMVMHELWLRHHVIKFNGCKVPSILRLYKVVDAMLTGSLRLYKSVDLPTKDRTTLGFWAGHRSSKIRVILARQWENDTELDISNNRINRATGPLVYQKRFYRTKFCICLGGSQVNSARITDSIHYGCVPVILSDYYDLPFNDIVDWHKFAVVLREKDDLKQILKNITQEEFVT